MNWRSRMVISVLAILGVVMAARARWASAGSRTPVVVATSSANVATSASPVVERSIKKEREARAAAIRETIETIQAECQRSANGDWARWSGQLAPLRQELIAKTRAAKAINPTATGYFEARSPVLEGRDNFPLFESAPEHYLQHIVEPASLDLFRNEHSVVTAVRWLEQRGIDVIFVPVPKMTEVYPEYFSDHCPADRIIAPHLRQTVLELLQADVEVVDLLPAFQQERDRSPEPLYQPADPHWGPRAQEIAVRMVAARLKRYAFVAQAQASRPICRLETAPFMSVKEGATYAALTPDQQRRAEAAQPRTFMKAVDYNSPSFDEHSPIVCIGDSYNGGFLERLIPELNMPVRSLIGGGETTQAFKEFLRDREMLKDCKVVLWLVCNSALKASWSLPQKIHSDIGGTAAK